MGTLFMIGNGFDLNCGMRTSYKDAYREYVQTDSDTKVIKAFKEAISSEIGNWGDFEIAMSKYAESLGSEKEFVECVSDFQFFLRGFLSRQEKLFFMSMGQVEIKSAVMKEIHESISSFYNGISNNVNFLMTTRGATSLSQIQFISFNYTTVFDKLIKSAYEGYSIHLNSVCHIHGGLEDPILGVDNETQLNTRYPLTAKGKRSFIKPFFNKQYDSLRVENAIEAIEKADTICVFGMSLGLSDLSWRNKIVSWLVESKTKNLILYDYENANKKFKTVSDRMNFEEDRKKQKLGEWEVEDVDKIFEQFHIVCGRNLFNVSDAIRTKHDELQKKGK